MLFLKCHLHVCSETGSLIGLELASRLCWLANTTRDLPVSASQCWDCKHMYSHAWLFYMTSRDQAQVLGLVWQPLCQLSHPQALVMHSEVGKA